MDERWKALTAPLWAEHKAARVWWTTQYAAHLAELERGHHLGGLGYFPAAYRTPEDIKRWFLRKTLDRLLELRRARLAGECPVYWKLTH